VSGVERAIGDLPVHYVEQGDPGGTPVLALHGGGVDSREALAFLEPVFAPLPGYRRIYPDLPGTGRTPAPSTIRSADDVLDVLLGLVGEVVGSGPLLLVGHSAGAYFAQALADALPVQVAGLALLCPLLPGVVDVPTHEVVTTVDGLGPAADEEFRSYFVVQTPEMLERYETAVRPGVELADPEAAARIGSRWQLTARGEAPLRGYPTLIVAGRQDATVGYARAWDLLARYPRATFAVLDGAGHALPHEQPALLGALMTEWLTRWQRAG